LEEPAFSVRVAAAQDNDEIKKTPNKKSPAGKKLYDADYDISHVKMMDSKPAKEEAKNKGYELGLGWRSVNHLLRMRILLRSRLGVLLRSRLSVLLRSRLSLLLRHRQGSPAFSTTSIVGVIGKTAFRACHRLRYLRIT